MFRSVILRSARAAISFSGTPLTSLGRVSPTSAGLAAIPTPIHTTLQIQRSFSSLSSYDWDKIRYACERRRQEKKGSSTFIADDGNQPTAINDAVGALANSCQKLNISLTPAQANQLSQYPTNRPDETMAVITFQKLFDFASLNMTVDIIQMAILKKFLSAGPNLLQFINILDTLHKNTLFSLQTLDLLHIAIKDREKSHLNLSELQTLFNHSAIQQKPSINAIWHIVSQNFALSRIITNLLNLKMNTDDISFMVTAMKGYNVSLLTERLDNMTFILSKAPTIEERLAIVNMLCNEPGMVTRIYGRIESSDGSFSRREISAATIEDKINGIKAEEARINASKVDAPTPPRGSMSW